MSEEIKEKKLTKEQKKDLKLKEKFKEIDKKFKRVDKLYKLSTEFEGFRNEEFNQLKENLCSQIDKHVEATINQYSHEIMIDIRDHQSGKLPIVSSKEAIKMLKKEVDDLKNNIHLNCTDSEACNGEINGEIVNIYGEVNSLKDTLNDLGDDLRKDMNEKHTYQNQRLNKQAETHRLKIEYIKEELEKLYKFNNLLKFDIEVLNNKVMSSDKRIDTRLDSHWSIIDRERGKVEELFYYKNRQCKDIEYLIIFIALNFGLTTFLLINFFMVFDF